MDETRRCLPSVLLLEMRLCLSIEKQPCLLGLNAACSPSPLVWCVCVRVRLWSSQGQDRDRALSLRLVYVLLPWMAGGFKIDGRRLVHADDESSAQSNRELHFSSRLVGR